MDYQESSIVLTVFRIMQQNKIQSLNGMPEHAKKKGKELKKMS